jgi:hypothetical protein
MRAASPPAANIAFFDDGKPIMNLRRENFLIVDADGTLNTLYRDADDETRLYITADSDGGRLLMVANRTEQGIPIEVVQLLKDTFAPDSAAMAVGMQRNEEYMIGMMMIVLAGGHWQNKELPGNWRN